MTHSVTLVSIVRSRLGAALQRLGTFVAGEPPPPPSFVDVAVRCVEPAVEMLAAMMPLPVAPLHTGDADKDLANLCTYQEALAEHAKRDEQLRSVARVFARVIG